MSGPRTQGLSQHRSERQSAEIPGVRGGWSMKDAREEGAQEEVSMAVFKAVLIAWEGGQRGRKRV